MNYTKGGSESYQENSRVEKGAWKKMLQMATDDPRFGCATQISNRDANTIQDLESRHEGLRESESYPTSMQDDTKWRA